MKNKEEVEIKKLIEWIVENLNKSENIKEKEALFSKLNFAEKEDINDLNNVSELKIHKILYFLYGIFWAKYGEDLFKPNFQSWRHGPVEQEYRKNKDILIKFKFDSETKEKQMYIIGILKGLVRFNVWRLVELSHQTTPWIDAGAGKKAYEQIDIQKMQKYFETFYKN